MIYNEINQLKMKHLQPFNESENTETDSEEIDTAVRGYELYTDTGLYSLSVYLKQEVCHCLPSYETMTIKFSEIQIEELKLSLSILILVMELFYFIKYTIIHSGLLHGSLAQKNGN